MSLRSFLSEVRKRKQFAQVNEEVSTRFEVSALMKEFDAGPVLYFNKVRNNRAKVVAGVCGTRQRLSWALEVAHDALYSKIIRAWRSPALPRIVDKGPVTEVKEKPRLSKLPILTHFERDAGPYITSSVISARSSDGRIENVSIHRLQVLDDTHLAIRLVPRHLFNMWKSAKEKKENLDIAITVGTHPAVMLAAASPVPYGLSEFGVANTLLEKELRLVKCENIDAYAPAEAEIVLEGRISTDKEILEGPLVDITGTYDIQRRQPVVELLGMMHRRDYIYQALLPSGGEHKLLMGLPHETLIWEAVSKVVPNVKAVNLSSGGCGWLHAIVSIDKLVDGDAKNALAAIFGAHQSVKHAAVVDTDIDVYDQEMVEWAVATRFQADEDLVIIPQARGSTLDPTADQETGLTTKMGIDATRPLAKPREKFARARIPSSRKIAGLIAELRDRFHGKIAEQPETN